ncbi:MAG TPA: histidine kinase [Acidimicrobiales bacterium]|nr:histidine kinase [Acidimicrobiales bacterium]
MALRWLCFAASSVLVARSTSSSGPLLWGLPIAAFAFLHTAEGYIRQPISKWVHLAGLFGELAAVAIVVGQTGGWHSGWVVSLVGVSALTAHGMPARWSGIVASGAVIVFFIALLLGRETLTAAQRSSVFLDVLLLVSALSVSYATWLARYGDRDRSQLARTNERLMATNDLLVLLEKSVLHGDDAADPEQAARAVARLSRELLQPEVIVVASVATVGDTWRILLTDGALIVGAVDDMEILAVVSAEAASGITKPIRVESGPALLSPEAKVGACIPLTVRGRLIGAVILETSDPDQWQERHYDMMAELSPWAALLVDNACRFNALWIVGSAEERARVARNLHDHLGQSMAALGLELDGLARASNEPALTEQIRELRRGVTGMVAELRYTMHDLNCDVSRTRSLGAALDQMVRVMHNRTTTEISLEVNAEERLPLAQEHQILQMARSLMGAGVEARAESVKVMWNTDGTTGCLEVGYEGFPEQGAWDPEPPILAAVAEVRERCWAVGATMEYVLPTTDSAAVVRCRVAS